MIGELSKANCPVCNNPIPLDNKHWIITCNSCKQEIEVVGYTEKIISIRRYLSKSRPENNVGIFLEYVKKNLPLEKWGFNKYFQLSNGYVFDSNLCRIKFELSQFDYYPLYEIIISYGRLHAKDNEKHINWNGKKCLCWHSNIHLIIPFIEGVSTQQLADDSKGEIWKSLVENLKVDYPHGDYLEYPLRLHAKIWEYYGEKFFSIFDLRKPELWEVYSRYSDKYNELINEYLHGKFDISRDIERIC